MTSVAILERDLLSVLGLRLTVVGLEVVRKLFERRPPSEHGAAHCPRVEEVAMVVANASTALAVSLLGVPAGGNGEPEKGSAGMSALHEHARTALAGG